MARFFVTRRSRKRLLFDWMLIGLLLLMVVAVYKFNTVENIIGGRARIVDGDTIRIDRRAIRLSGIDAPERAQECSGPKGNYACGAASTRHLSKLIGRRSVYCDGWQLDVYDRLLAECFVGNPAPGSVSINAQMVRDGWAVAYGGYASDERLAKRAKRGIWVGKFDLPSNWRAIRGNLNGTEVDFVQSIWNRIKNIAGSTGQ